MTQKPPSKFDRVPSLPGIPFGDALKIVSEKISPASSVEDREADVDNRPHSGLPPAASSDLRPVVGPYTAAEVRPMTLTVEEALAEVAGLKISDITRRKDGTYRIGISTQTKKDDSFPSCPGQTALNEQGILTITDTGQGELMNVVSILVDPTNPRQLEHPKREPFLTALATAYCAKKNLDISDGEADSHRLRVKDVYAALERDIRNSIQQQALR